MQFLFVVSVRVSGTGTAGYGLFRGVRKIMDIRGEDYGHSWRRLWTNMDSQYLTSWPQTTGELQRWLWRVFMSLAEMEYDVVVSDWDRIKAVLQGRGQWDKETDLQFQKLESLSGEIFQGPLENHSRRADSEESSSVHKVPSRAFVQDRLHHHKQLRLC